MNSYPAYLIKLRNAIKHIKLLRSKKDFTGWLDPEEAEIGYEQAIDDVLKILEAIDE